MTSEEMEKLGIFASEYSFRLNDQLKVSYRGTGLWAVTEVGACLNKDGEWEYEPSPSRRDQAFFDRCRFTLHEALRRAAAISGYKEDK